jgi:hypothetical protein
MRLVHFPESPDPRFSLYLDAPEESSVYTVENGTLVQYGRHVDGTLDSGADVDFFRGVPDDAVLQLRTIETLLRDTGKRLAEIERVYAEWKRRSA